MDHVDLRSVHAVYCIIRLGIMDVLDVPRPEAFRRAPTAWAACNDPNTHINGVTFVPLAMAPFHESDLIRPSTPKHKVCVIVTLKHTSHNLQHWALKYMWPVQRATQT